MKKFKAAVFDMDGTLLDTMYIWRHLAPEYLRKHNVTPPPELEAKMTIMGMAQAANFLISEFGIKESAEALHNEMVEILADYYRHHSVFKPGTEEFLQKLQAKNVPTIILSATPLELVQIAMEKLDAAKYFSHGLLSCSTIKCAKNKPEAFFIAAETLGTPPEDTIIFEDAWYAASTAKAAGFPLCVMHDIYDLHPAEMQEIADWYIHNNWNEFPVDDLF